MTARATLARPASADKSAPNRRAQGCSGLPYFDLLGSRYIVNELEPVYLIIVRHKVVGEV
jgi:hypothetical protein